MSEPHTPIDGLPDPVRRGDDASDPPLSLDARTPGPRGGGGGGGGGKMGFAVLGLLILFGMVAAMWIASQQGRKGQIEKAPSQVELRP